VWLKCEECLNKNGKALNSIPILKIISNDDDNNNNNSIVLNLQPTYGWSLLLVGDHDP
jgi:hypothetical protein